MKRLDELQCDVFRRHASSVISHGVTRTYFDVRQWRDRQRGVTDHPFAVNRGMRTNGDGRDGSIVPMA